MSTKIEFRMEAVFSDGKGTSISLGPTGRVQITMPGTSFLEVDGPKWDEIVGAVNQLREKTKAAQLGKWASAAESNG